MQSDKSEVNMSRRPTTVMPYPDCLFALRAIKPGEFIAYGYEFNIKQTAYRHDESDAERDIRRTVMDLDEKMRIMRFQMRVSSHQFLLLARGVDPCVREQLERALKRLEIPKPAIPTF